MIEQTGHADTPGIHDGFAGQPTVEVERDGVHYTLLGTAHVSKASIDAVLAAIDSGRFDAVAVELDEQRHKALTQPDTLAQLDIIQVIREGKVAPFAANLALAAYQRRLAEQLDIEPGAELKAAATEAAARGLPLQLIDRDVGITFRRILQGLGWWERAKLGGGILGGLLADDQVSEDDIERLKEGDMLESSFGEFARDTPALYATLIDERDQYMASKLRERSDGARHVLAVVGAGHLAGMARYLGQGQEAPDAIQRTLTAVKPKSRVPWMELVIATFVIGGFAWGFWKGGIDVGTELVVQWVLATGVLGALGCAIAGGHPLSIVAAFIASPLTPLHPALASGTVSAFVEATLRKPTYADFLALREDVQTARGWWRNRVARVLLNFFLTSLGTAIGVWTGGLSMLGKLV